MWRFGGQVTRRMAPAMRSSTTSMVTQLRALSSPSRSLLRSARQLGSTNLPRRYINNTSFTPSKPTSPPRTKSYRFATLTAVSIFAAGSVAVATSPLHADSEVLSQSNDSKQPLSSLIRAYVVYSMCSIPPLVENATYLLGIFTSIPGLKQITEGIVRITFFNQFVGAETAQGTIPLLEQLRSENKGALFGYSVEVDEKAAASQGASPLELTSTYRENVEEMIRSIDVAGDFEDQLQAKPSAKGVVSGRKTWIAMKLSALLPSAHALAHFSQYLLATRPTDNLVHYPGTPHSTDLDILKLAHAPPNCPLTDTDFQSLKRLNEDLDRICTRARERNVTIIIDAEHTWYQPAIDAFQLSLMRKFNATSKPKSVWLPITHKSNSHPNAHKEVQQPLVYGTFQSYLRRNTMHLIRSIEAAERDGYVLGVKLVRGAYHNQEHRRLAPYHPDIEKLQRTVDRVNPGFPRYSIGPKPPVWDEKSQTDANYNTTAGVLLDYLTKPNPPVGLLFGTHNWESSDHIIQGLVSRGLATVTKREKDGSVKRCRVDDRIAGRIAFGQLYGMKDGLTDYLAGKLEASSPIAMKYIPYGGLSEVIPYLGRRAVENKSVLGAAQGGAADERRRAGAEIWKRVVG